MPPIRGLATSVPTAIMPCWRNLQLVAGLLRSAAGGWLPTHVQRRLYPTRILLRATGAPRRLTQMKGNHEAFQKPFVRLPPTQTHDLYATTGARDGQAMHMQ